MAFRLCSFSLFSTFAFGMGSRIIGYGGQGYGGAQGGKSFFRVVSRMSAVWDLTAIWTSCCVTSRAFVSLQT